ncbi:MAG: cell division protease FtsH, partial [Saprospiraceae bacterium]
MKNIVLWLIIAAVLLSVFQNFGTSTPDKMINYSTFIEDVQRGNVESIVVKGSIIEGLTKNATAFKTTRPAV